MVEYLARITDRESHILTRSLITSYFAYFGMLTLSSPTLVIGKGNLLLAYAGKLEHFRGKSKPKSISFDLKAGVVSLRRLSFNTLAVLSVLGPCIGRCIEHYLFKSSLMVL